MATRTGFIVPYGGVGRSVPGDQSPALQADPETPPAPVHDQAPRKTVRIRCRAGVGRDGRACRLEPARTHCVHRMVVEAVGTAKGVREVRNPSAAHALELLLRGRDRFLLLVGRKASETHMIGRVGTDGHDVGARQLGQIRTASASGRRGVTRRTRPTPRRRCRGHDGSRPQGGAAGGAGSSGGPHRAWAHPVRSGPPRPGSAGASRGHRTAESATACPVGPTRSPVGRPRPHSSHRR